MKRISIFCVFALGCLLLTVKAFAATVVIQNSDPANVGFNDTTAATPVGGNNGTTLGQQRLNVFQFAANIWGTTLSSNQTIIVDAAWVSQTCTTNSAVLGSAGASTNVTDFAAAPFPATWYPIALANKLSNTDLRPASTDITARFNVNVGQSGCLTGHPFYLGLDNNHGSNPDLVTVLIHELGHGLGFSTLTDASTGAYALGFPTIYDRFLIRDGTGKSWLQMTDAERAASALLFDDLAWDGPQSVSDAQTVLSAGKDALSKPFLYAPASFQAGSSVSHWTTTATPNQIMEPAINSDLPHSVTFPADLTFSLLSDIGWVPRSLPSVITKTDGDVQRAGVGSTFADPISVTISAPSSGLQVTWTVNPVNGAGASFVSNSALADVSTTDARGVAVAPALRATGVTGNFTLNATVAGAGTTAFTLRSVVPARH